MVLDFNMDDRDRFNLDGHWVIRTASVVIGVLAFTYWVNTPFPPLQIAPYDGAIAVAILIGCIVVYFKHLSK